MGELLLAKTKSNYKEKVHRQRALLSKLKLDSHHKMERFAVSLAVCGTLLCVNLIASGAHAHTEHKRLMTTKSLYTTNADFSKSGVAANVKGIYVLPDHRTGYLVFKLANASSSMSLDPNKYSVFVTAYNAKNLDHPKMTGDVFILGSTGYMGVMLYDAQGFSNQVLDVVIRANVDLSGVQASNVPSNADKSFAKFDQMQIFVNPGAHDVLVLNDLKSKSRLTGEEMYMLFEGSATEESLTKTYKGLEQQEAVLRTRIKEYTSRLKSYGVENITKPEWVKPGYVLPKGYVINDSMSIMNSKKQPSYIDTFFDADFESYLKNRKTYEEEQATAVEEVSASYVPETSLAFKDGGAINIESANSKESVLTSSDKDALASFSVLQQTYTELLSVLQRKQYEIPWKLMDLEAELRSQSENLKYSKGNRFITY